LWNKQLSQLGKPQSQRWRRPCVCSILNWTCRSSGRRLQEKSWQFMLLAVVHVSHID
jgi:hypothetical protein